MDAQREMNPYPDDYAKASEHLRQALALLSKHQIPPSPLNYRISYDVTAGRNEKLKGELAQHLTAATEAKSDDTLWELYARHFIQDDVALDELRKELRTVVTSLQDEFKRAGGNIAGYTSTLDRFAGILNKETSVEAISSEVQQVIHDTRDMEASQSRLENQMSHVMSEMEAMRQELEQVRKESLTDGLTGIANRKAFDTALEQTLRIAQDTNQSTCLLLADIDHFKNFNDTHGHLVGDKVLRFVASTLKRCIKGKDTAARFGGEEFAIILPNTDLTGARTAAEQIRNEISSGTLINKNRGEAYGSITISIGIAKLNQDDNVLDLIHRADESLYLAKNRGRNRVEYAGAA
ncbi:MAG: GGDEF domain-containing protein [Sedimenticola sp.]|nr:GGDEF domain-containing protein [Sedimenticola sp.]